MGHQPTPSRQTCLGTPGRGTRLRPDAINRALPGSNTGVNRTARTGPWLTLTPLALVLATAPALAQSEVSSSAPCPDGNLLAGRKPWAWNDIRGRLHVPTDGEVAPEGAMWDASLATVLDSGAATLTWDLGQSIPVRAIWVQADAQDEYGVWGSLDGRRFLPLGRVDGGFGTRAARPAGAAAGSLGSLPALRRGSGRQLLLGVGDPGLLHPAARIPAAGAGGAGPPGDRPPHHLHLLERRDERPLGAGAGGAGPGVAAVGPTAATRGAAPSATAGCAIACWRRWACWRR